MIVVNVTRDDLEAALDTVNKAQRSEAYPDGNLTWNRAPVAINGKGTRWRLTLRCVSSQGPGHSVVYNPATGRSRRWISACWHTHGIFFDALPPCAKIITRAGITSPGDPWLDYSIGSRLFPRYASDACECYGDLED